MKIDFKELVKMVEEVSGKDYQKSDRIKTHASRRMSTKGKTNKVGKPYSQDPPTARTKSAPPGFGFTMEELYKLIPNQEGVIFFFLTKISINLFH